MICQPITREADCNVISIGDALRRLVLRMIDAEDDLTEKKARIMIAYQHGHLTAREAEDWIVSGGMADR